MIKRFIRAGFLTFTALVMLLGVAVLQPAPAQAAGRCTDASFYKGMNHPCVVYIQKMLNHIGNAWLYDNYARLDPNGGFGVLTEGQVKNYQRATHNLTIDGRVGQNTWKSLCGMVRVFYEGNIFVGYPKRYDPTDIYMARGEVYNAARDAGCVKFDDWYNWH